MAKAPVGIVKPMMQNASSPSATMAHGTTGAQMSGDLMAPSGVPPGLTNRLKKWWITSGQTVQCLHVQLMVRPKLCM